MTNTILLKGDIMNILLISFHKIINSSGGVEKVFCEMANHLVSQGHVVKAICYNDEEGKPFYDIDERVDFINAGVGAKKDRPLFYKLRRALFFNKASRLAYDDLIDNIIRKKRMEHLISGFSPDIIISYSIESTKFLSEVLKLTNKCITMLHTNPHDALDKIEKTFLRKLRKENLCIQVLTPGYAKICKDFFKLTNVVYIPNIAPQYKYFDYNKRNNTIINVARFDNMQKRQHILIEAFSKIASEFSDWKVEFWGDQGYDLEYYRFCTNLVEKYNLSSQIKFCGISNEIEEKLKLSKIFAFPSAFEGFSLALAEAMSVGTTPIAFKSCSGTNEMIVSGENGILCDEGVNAFSEKLRDLMVDEKLCEFFGKKSHEDMKCYSSENVWKRWEQLIDKIIIDEALKI